jgi:caa(3)-type oxidase subunit IV
MHSEHASDPAEVRKSIRSYMIVFGMLMVFTVLTVAVAALDVSIPLAITIALIIASMKAAMVAGVFMHLLHERQAIYGTLLLTAVFFLALIFIPLFTSMDAVRYGG